MIYIFLFTYLINIFIIVYRMLLTLFIILLFSVLLSDDLRKIKISVLFIFFFLPEYAVLPLSIFFLEN